jgi:hypothetical protein
VFIQRPWATSENTQTTWPVHLVVQQNPKVYPSLSFSPTSPFLFFFWGWGVTLLNRSFSHVLCCTQKPQGKLRCLSMSLFYSAKFVTEVPLRPKVFQLSTLQVGLTDYIHTSLKLSKEMLHQLPSALAHSDHSASLSNGHCVGKGAEA